MEADTAEPPLILVGPPVSLRLRLPNGAVGVGCVSKASVGRRPEAKAAAS